MKAVTHNRSWNSSCLFASLMLLSPMVFAQDVAVGDWITIANSSVIVPEDSAARPFSSFNPPSVNTRGFVVFRGRSRGPEPPASGIFGLDTSRSGSGQLYRLAGRQSMVPDPNNTGARFNEFPSFPRLGLHGKNVATRGNSAPVWSFTTPEGESRAGTTGIFAANDGYNLATSMTQLGLVPGFERHQVPGSLEITRFEMFPGAPAITDEGFVVSKGNYTDHDGGGTGVFYRDLLGGDTPIELIANSKTKIPEAPDGVAGITFGSTAPPSAARGRVVFVGLDNEEMPSYGGIYIARIAPSPRLRPLVSIGDPVPGVRGQSFIRIGEGLSFDGRHVGFWGAWGDAKRVLRLHCPSEGNKQRLKFCRDEDPLTNRDTDERWQEISVPVNQGFFVIDTKTGNVRLIARTGRRFTDFLYWKYTGHPPGMGDSHADAEPPRWRSSAYLAVSNLGNSAAYTAAFLSRHGEVDPNTLNYEDYTDGICLRRVPGRFSIERIIETGMAGSILDREAPADVKISELGLERDGFRGRYLAISASMATEEAEGSHGSPGDSEATWAGIYLAKVPAWSGRK